MELVPAGLDLVAEAQVNRQVRRDLEVILGKHLGLHLAHSIDRAVRRIPVIHLAKEKVRIAESASGKRRLSW